MPVNDPVSGSTASDDLAVITCAWLNQLKIKRIFGIFAVNCRRYTVSENRENETSLKMIDAESI